MSKISASPNRMSFQKEGAIKRAKEKGEELSEDYLSYFETAKERHDARFEDPQAKIDNLEYDLLTTDWILEKVRECDIYAQNLYAAMCNRDFQKLEVLPVLKDQRWSCSWRYAGGIIADMQQKGDYIDWYCSGIRGDKLTDEEIANLSEEQKEYYLQAEAYVGEGVVTDEIQADLKRLGWVVLDDMD